MIIHKWKLLSSTEVTKLLKGDFPKCGVKYTNQYSKPLVLIKYGVSDLGLIKDKIKAAGKGSYNFIIPRQVANVCGI